ncbi:MAG: T9SS type A sorting domain-containing protein, partial [candidate division WOR-3 bacterium]
KKVSVFIPCSLYADGKVIVDIEKVKRRYVICGEISIYEFDREEKRELASGTQEGEVSIIPCKFFFGPVYPNPVKGMLKIRYGLNRPIKVKISVYNVLGRLVKRLKDKVEPAGCYEIAWDTEKLPQGVYFV